MHLWLQNFFENFAILGHLCVRAHSVVGQNHLRSLVITFGMSLLKEVFS